MQEVSRLQENTQTQVDELARKMEADKQQWMRAQKDGTLFSDLILPSLPSLSKHCVVFCPSVSLAMESEVAQRVAAANQRARVQMTEMIDKLREDMEQRVKSGLL